MLSLDLTGGSEMAMDGHKFPFVPLLGGVFNLFCGYGPYDVVKVFDQSFFNRLNKSILYASKLL